MDKKKAREILACLLRRTADCRCGNYELTREEVEAITLLSEEKDA